jgi:peptidyl-prolyl cis-trans isomerase SurA
LILALERWRGFLLASLAVGVFFSGCNRPESDKDVMAKVNNYKILRSEVDKSYNSQIAGSPQKPTPTEEQALRLNLLQQIIDVQLHLQKAEKLGVNVADDEVDAKINQAKAPYTKEEWEKKLKEAGITEDDYRREIQRNLIIDKLLNKEIASKVTISDADIRNYYEQNKAQFNLIEPLYYVAEIVVGNQPSPQNPEIPDKAQNDAQARKKIQMIYNRLESGEDFGTVASKYSEDVNTRRNGGELQPIPESTLKGGSTDAGTRDAVLKLKPGQYSNIITIVNPQTHQATGYRIVKLFGKEPAGQRSLDDPSVQQMIRNQLRTQREQILRAAYDEVLRDNADIKNYYAEQILKNAGQK